MKALKNLIIILFYISPVVHAQKAIRIPMGQSIEQSKELPVSTIAENIRFIPLETNENCLFNTNISKIEILDQFIFISDYNYIFKYDLNGKFLKRIGKKGHGPGEYVQGFLTFLIDKTSQTLIVFEMITKRMIVYDFDGNFVKEEKIDFLPGPTEWTSDDNMAVYNMGFTYEKETWHDFYVLNREAKMIQKNKFAKQPDKRYGLIIYPAIFYRYDGKTRYKNPHENIIYELDEKNKTRPVYYLDYGKYEKYADIDDAEIQIKNNLGVNRANPESFEKIGLLGLSETAKYLFIYYGHREQRKVGVYDKAEHTFYNLYDKNNKLYGFHDNLYGGLPVFPKGGINNNLLYTYYNAFEFKDFLNKATQLDSNVKKIVSEIHENDNPVLMLIQLKE